MRLKKSQKEAVLTWIAEGLRSDEINGRAAQFELPFQIDRRQVDYYRRTRKADLEAINKISEKTALIEGYALREHRVYKLAMLAALMEKDIMGGFLWTDQVKGVGSGDIAEIVDYEEFNAGEVIQYRGVLDDIAKETGGRAIKQDIGLYSSEQAASLMSNILGIMQEMIPDKKLLGELGEKLKSLPSRVDRP